MQVIEVLGVFERKKKRSLFEKIKCIFTDNKINLTKSIILSYSGKTGMDIDDYINKINSVWRKNGENFLQLSNNKNLVAYDKKDEYEYFIFNDEHDEVIGDESKTISLIILAKDKEIALAINDIQKKIQKKFKYKFLKFSIRPGTKCRLYSYDYAIKDIRGEKQSIGIDIDKVRTISKAEITKSIINAALLIVFLILLIIFIDDNTAKSVAEQSAENLTEQSAINLNELINIPIITNLIASAIFIAVLDLIYYMLKYYQEKDKIHIQNIQGLIDSLDEVIDNSALDPVSTVQNMQETDQISIPDMGVARTSADLGLPEM